MKKTITTSICFLALITMGCNNPIGEEVQLTIFADVTGSNEHLDVDLTIRHVEALFKFAENDRNYGDCRFIILDDTHLPTIWQAKLPPVPKNSYNKYARAAEIRKFQKEVGQLLEDLKHVPIGRNGSSLFIPLNKELSRLASSNAKRKVCIAYTDLFESSLITFNTYGDVNLEDFETQPQKMRKLLVEKAPLAKNLNGIEFLLVYEPKIQSDQNFYRISLWYKRILEERNSKVHISSSLVL